MCKVYEQILRLTLGVTRNYKGKMFFLRLTMFLIYLSKIRNHVYRWSTPYTKTQHEKGQQSYSPKLL